VNKLPLLLSAAALVANVALADQVSILNPADDVSAGLPDRDVSQHPIALMQNGAAQTGGDTVFLLWPKTTGNGGWDGSDVTNQSGIRPDSVTLTLSTYDQETLTKYCNQGTGLSELQWRSLYSSDVAALTDVWDFSSCQPPAYSYQEYLAAFTGYCSGIEFNDLDESSQFIVLNSGKDNFPSLSIESCSSEE
jgi:hypothetical protein